MWRALFLAIGVTLCILGFEALVLDKAVLATDSFVATAKSTETEPIYDEYSGIEIGTRPVPAGPRTIVPPEWAPWSLLSSGTVTLFYALLGRERE